MGPRFINNITKSHLFSTTNTGRADPRREERTSREGPMVEEAVGRKKHGEMITRRGRRILLSTKKEEVLHRKAE